MITRSFKMDLTGLLGLIPVLLNIILFAKIGSATTPLNCPSVNFARNNTPVWFDPYASVEDILYLQKYTGPELHPLVQQAATAFNRLMLPLYDPAQWSAKRNYSALELIPGIVARLNRDQDRMQTPIQIWIVNVISSENWEDSDDGRSLQRLMEICDNANSIYPGTVTVVVDYYNYKSVPRSPPSKERISNLKDSGYRYGMILPLEVRLSSGNELTSFLKEASKNLDILMFAHSPSNQEVEEGKVTSSIKKVIKLFEETQTACIREFLSSSARSQLTPVGFITEWPDTGENGTVNYQNLVSYWGNISSWAAMTGSQLVLRNAFDTPYEYDIGKKTRGWWRLIENVEGDVPHPSPKHECMEKIGLPSGSEELAKLSKNLTWLEQDTQFSREHVILRFDPYISNGRVDKWESGKNDGNHLSHLFLQVATKISKIVIHELSLFEDEGDHRLSMIPGVVSRIKRFNGDPKGASPYEVILTVREIDEWDKTKKVADKANLESPGTVRTLQIQVNDDVFPPERMEQLRKFFQYARNHSGMGHHLRERYQLSGLFISDKCFIPEDTPEFMEEMAPLVPYFDKISFMEVIDWENNMMMLGVDRLFVQLTSRFEYCRQKIQRVAARSGSQVKVGLLTGWQDTDSLGRKSYAGQVKFWEMMNGWAVRTNTEIIFLEAFDQARKKEGGHLGWWRLIPNESYQSVSEFKFEDKKALALEAFLGKPYSTNFTGLSSMAIIAVITVTILIIALIYVTSMLLLRRKREGGKPHLTREDLQEFFEGIQEEIKLANKEGGNQPVTISTTQHCSRPYDKEQFELVKSSFVVDEKLILGSGEFGKVCRGKVRLERSEQEENALFSKIEERNVAVKMANSNSSNPATAVRGLLSEIKILSYLGMHENIVSLIGAYTASLSRDNTVYLFLELCEGGSLEKYLRKWDISKAQKKKKMSSDEYMNMADGLRKDSSGYVNPSMDRTSGVELYKNVVSSTPSESYANMETSFVDISQDLYRWAGEICNGMEFLASKNVVHADLATRNVLLTGERKTAKISDFGLSRRLYDYTNYVKSKQEPLPWRWMAPESLRRLEFNEKTDVWAFGVTLWEIFSCGEIPFPGLSWDVDFCMQLENGLRMSKPPHSDQEMYERVMLKCWQMDEDERPTFKELKGILCFSK